MKSKHVVCGFWALPTSLSSLLVWALLFHPILCFYLLQTSVIAQTPRKVHLMHSNVLNHIVVGISVWMGVVIIQNLHCTLYIPAQIFSPG